VIRKTIRDETLKTSDVGTLKAEKAKLEQQKKMGSDYWSNEKGQRLTQLEASLKWHEVGAVQVEYSRPK
jgi:hypothetical protein